MSEEHKISAEELAKYIDHTLLKPSATSSDIKQLCTEAAEHGFACVSINQRWVPLAKEILKDTGVNVGAVVSLPLGADSTKVKVAAAKEAIAAGADEIDMVTDLASVIEGDAEYLTSEFEAMLDVCHSSDPKITLKVIIESAALTAAQKIFVCELADKCGIDFVKTSTGMNPAGGATIEDVRLMKRHAPNCKIKAAGGIRTLQQITNFISAGANRIGTSSGVKIISEIK